MNFLRRLDPGRAATPGAARLDVVPRWLEPATTPLDAQAARRFDADVLPMARPIRPQLVTPSRERQLAPSLVPSAASGETPSAGEARPRTSAPRAALPAQLDRPTQAATALRATEARPSNAASNGGGGQLGIAPPRPTPAPDVNPPRRAVPLPHGPVPSPDVPERPLRADAIAERRPRAAREPPIVHVTIDRIDVRLPAVEASPSPRERRPRAPGGMAPLSDYLRGGGRG